MEHFVEIFFSLRKGKILHIPHRCRDLSITSQIILKPALRDVTLLGEEFMERRGGEETKHLYEAKPLVGRRGEHAT